MKGAVVQAYPVSSSPCSFLIYLLSLDLFIHIFIAFEICLIMDAGWLELIFICQYIIAFIKWLKKFVIQIKRDIYCSANEF